MNKIQKLYADYCQLEEEAKRLEKLAFVEYDEYTDESGMTYRKCVKSDDHYRECWYMKTIQIRDKEDEILSCLKGGVYQTGDKFLVPMWDEGSRYSRLEILGACVPEEEEK